MRRLLSLALIAALVAAPLQARPLQGLPPGTAKGPTSFLFGAFTQRVSTHATWKERRINTLVTAYASFVSGNAAAYNASAEALNLWQIRSPEPGAGFAASAAADRANPAIMAWNLTDEPDGAGNKTPAQLTAEAAILRAAGPNKAIKGNFLAAGMASQGQNCSGNLGYTPNCNPYTGYWDMVNLDWTSGDTYPDSIHNQNQPVQLFLSSWNLTSPIQPYLETTVGAAAANVYAGPWRTLPVGTAGKTTFQYFGTGRVDLNNPNPKPPSASLFRALTWSSIINGASGVFLFPQVMATLDFTASITGTDLDITAPAGNWGANGGNNYGGYTLNPNKIYVGLNLAGTGVTPAKIVSQDSGTPGGIGHYTISVSQNVSSRSMSLTDDAIGNGDGSDPLVLQELQTLINNVNIMQGLGSNLLMDKILGGRRAFTVYHSRDWPSGDPNLQLTAMPAISVNPTNYGCTATLMALGFEGATISWGGVTYFLILNLIGAPRTLDCAPGGANPWNVSGMTFGKYEVKLFTNLSTVNLLTKAGVDD